VRIPLLPLHPTPVRCCGGCFQVHMAALTHSSHASQQQQQQPHSASAFASSSPSSSSSLSSSVAAASASSSAHSAAAGDESTIKTDTLAALFPLVDADTLACMLAAHAGDLAATIRTVAGDGVFDAPTAADSSQSQGQSQSAGKRGPHDALQAAHQSQHLQPHSHQNQPQPGQPHHHRDAQPQLQKSSSSSAHAASVPVPRPLFDPREHERIAADGNLTWTQKQMFYNNGCGFCADKYLFFVA
jgi:hypothetical protein